MLLFLLILGLVSLLLLVIVLVQRTNKKDRSSSSSSSFNGSSTNINTNNNNTYHVLIPVGPNDQEMLEKVLKRARTMLNGAHKIFVVGANIQCSSSLPNQTIFVHEDKVINTEPFQESFGSRLGWYKQQLIKLCAWKYIPDLNEHRHYLVLDCDTLFLRPLDFFHNGLPLYAFGHERHLEYFRHMKRLSKEFQRSSKKSGICHHMMFDIQVLKEIHQKTIEEHGSTLAFETIFLQCVDPKHRSKSGASEYELYFHYLHRFHPNEFLVRNLDWKNVSVFDENDPVNNDFVSVHHYMRKSVS